MLKAVESPVLQLQQLALDESVAVAQLLRLAKTVATKLGVQNATQWIDDELNGYMGSDKVPVYRQLHGDWQGLFPRFGWQPLVFNSNKVHARWSFCPMGEPISALEEAYRGGKSNRMLAFTGAHEVRALLVSKYNLIDARLVFGATRVWGIVDRVRTLVLNWSLELEKAGILGDGLTFSRQEKQEAIAVTNYFIQNAGVVGNVSGGTISNKQDAEISVDLTALGAAIEQSRKYLGDLPPATAAELESVLDALEREVPTAQPTRVQELLKSAQTILEGAAGTVAAEGLKALFRMLT